MGNGAPSRPRGNRLETIYRTSPHLTDPARPVLDSFDRFLFTRLEAILLSYPTVTVQRRIGGVRTSSASIVAAASATSADHARARRTAVLPAQRRENGGGSGGSAEGAGETGRARGGGAAPMALVVPTTSAIHERIEFQFVGVDPPQMVEGHLQGIGVGARTRAAQLDAEAAQLIADLDAMERCPDRFSEDQLNAVGLAAHTAQLQAADLRRGIGVTPPRLSPDVARIGDLTYAATIRATVRMTVSRRNEATGAWEAHDTKTQKVIVGDLPVMVKSALCVATHPTYARNPRDSDYFGGYFIVKGTERVLLSQERGVSDVALVFRAKRPPKRVRLLSGHPLIDAALSAEPSVALDASEEADDAEGGSSSRKRTSARATRTQRASERALTAASAKAEEKAASVAATMAAVDDETHLVCQILSTGHTEWERSSTAIGMIQLSLAKTPTGARVIHVSLPRFVDAPFPLTFLLRVLLRHEYTDKWADDAIRGASLYPDARALNDILAATYEDGLTYSRFHSREEDPRVDRSGIDAAHHQFARRVKRLRESERRVVTKHYAGDAMPTEEEIVDTYVTTHVLPHMNSQHRGETRADERRGKARFLCYMAERLLKVVLGISKCDDPDHLMNKRFDLPGDLMAYQFCVNLETAMRQVHDALWKTLDDLKKTPTANWLQCAKKRFQFDTNLITMGMSRAFSSGQFARRPGRAPHLHSGVSQTLPRFNLRATLSAVRRVISSVKETSLLMAPRQLSGTRWGMLCPFETSEGEGCGLSASLASHAYVTTGILSGTAHVSFQGRRPPAAHHAPDTDGGTRTTGRRSREWMRAVCSLPRVASDRASAIVTTAALVTTALKPLEAMPGVLVPLARTPLVGDHTRVFLNGIWRWTTLRAEKVVEACKRIRRGLPFELVSELSVRWDAFARELHLLTDGGRPVRPLFVSSPVTGEAFNLEDPRLNAWIQEEEMRTDVWTSSLWPRMVHEGMIEYVDASETETALIAQTYADYCAQLDEGRVDGAPRSRDVKEPHGVRNGSGGGGSSDGTATRRHVRRSTRTHCEIYPVAILGIAASMSPFLQHNQSPRNVYQVAMGKQMLDAPLNDLDRRVDAGYHALVAPQRALVTTATQRLFDPTNGIGADPAKVLVLTGVNNIEDSLIGNRASFDRGMFRTVSYHTMALHEEASPLSELRFARAPDKERSIRTGRDREMMDRFDADGLPLPGTRLEGGDFLASMRRYEWSANQTQSADQKEGKDASPRLKPTEGGVVHTVRLVPRGRTRTPSSSTLVGRRIYTPLRTALITIREYRTPIAGDKFSSRHGQKGVLSDLWNAEDMPWCARTGMIPDLIINPHAFPSRMTMGQILETIFSIVPALTGKPRDGTAWADSETRGHDLNQSRPPANRTLKRICDELHSVGYSSSGAEVMYSGHTGVRYHGVFLVGPVYYQRLKHMVSDKIQAHATGKVNKITWQPVGGRGNDGGIRFGEMERDCLGAHGVTAVISERLLHASDASHVFLCSRCGWFRLPEAKTRTFKPCYFCQSDPPVNKHCIPRAFHVLMLELKATGILLRLRTHDAPSPAPVKPPPFVADMENFAYSGSF